MLDTQSVSSDTLHSDDTMADDEAIEDEILELQARLAEAKARLESSRQGGGSRRRPPAAAPTSDCPPSPPSATPPPTPPPTGPPTPSLPAATHFLLLLSDSALPLGAFAFSSGLESFLAHEPPGSSGGGGRHASPPAAFAAFLPASVSAFASAALPFALAGHRDPAALPYLDDALDAAVVCAVGRRASVAQGRALLSVWERCFAPALLAGPPPPLSSSSSSASASQAAAVEAVASFAAAVRAAPAPASTDEDDDDADDSSPLPPSAHLAPLFGAVCRAAGLGERDAAAVLVVSHVKALVSAAVRAGVFGPYQAQRLLAGARVRELVDAAVAREWDTPVELAGQTVPVMDLWFGRHELLYSRIFNS